MQFNLVCASTAEVPKWVRVRNVRKKSVEDGQKITILDRRGGRGSCGGRFFRIGVRKFFGEMKKKNA